MGPSRSAAQRARADSSTYLDLQQRVHRQDLSRARPALASAAHNFAKTRRPRAPRTKFAPGAAAAEIDRSTVPSSRSRQVGAGRIQACAGSSLRHTEQLRSCSGPTPLLVLASSSALPPSLFPLSLPRR